MSHFPDLLLGLWMQDTPTGKVLGRSSDIGNLSLLFLSIICLNEPQHGAKVDLPYTVDARNVFCFCSHPRSSSPRLLSLCFHDLGGTGSFVVPTVIFYSSHMVNVTSPVSFPPCGCSGLFYIFSVQEVH